MCNDSTDVFAFDDDYSFGILHSRIHEVWSRAMGTQLKEVESGFRYTPTTCFETFPFPEPNDAQRAAISDAAKRLTELRENWLNPMDINGSPSLRMKDLKKRTLTNLYNARPTWLNNAHQTLDHAVAAAYNWPPNLDNNAILNRLLTLNLQRAAFNQLAAQWEKETAFDSFMEKKANHPAHQQILAMGEAAIPFILRRIEQKGGLWYWTLETITGLPSPAGIQLLETAPWVAIDVKEVNAAWLQWGREQGYIW